jgi:hypothetical protein
MALSADDIVSKFPVKTLPTIHGEPDYETINNMVQTLYGNAASLSTTSGGGAHGHIGIIMTQALYATLTATPYNAPPDPGTVPQIPGNANTAAREAIRIAHKEARRIYDNHVNMDDALKGQVIDTIDDTYLCEMRNKYTGYLGVTTRDLLDHLIDRYGKITPADLETNKKRMNEPIDSTQTIDVFFKRIDDCIQYADDGEVPFTPEQILQTTYHAVSTSGHYNDACKIWRKKPAADKTWPLFKTYFAEEYHDLKEQQKVNTSQTQFHGANSVLDISTALDNLAMAATTDRDIVAQLTQSNKQLVEMNAILTAQLKNAMENNNLLIKKIGNTTSKSNSTALKNATYAATVKTTTPAPYDRNAPFNHANWLASLDPTGYCWTHGYRVQVGHNSKDCKGKLGGHNDEATRADIKGGSTKGKDKE